VAPTLSQVGKKPPKDDDSDEAPQRRKSKASRKTSQSYAAIYYLLALFLPSVIVNNPRCCWAMSLSIPLSPVLRVHLAQFVVAHVLLGQDHQAARPGGGYVQSSPGAFGLNSAGNPFLGSGSGQQANPLYSSILLGSFCLTSSSVPRIPRISSLH
jgi:hypothetical protein